MTDCLEDLKRRFQRFVDGQNTFEELKLAANLVAVNCSDRDVVDFISTAHRKGLLSDNHYRLLIDDISVVMKQSGNSTHKHTPHIAGSENSAKGVAVLNGRFVLGPVIGRGGMGVVYKAQDLRKTEVNDKDDIVAIKVLSSELRVLPKYLVALQREAKKAQILAHPNIVTVYDFDRDGEIAYMTMEYLDGVPLNTVIHGHAPLPKKEAIRLIQDIARGLDYAHKHKIVHSDLKPSNIFLLRNGKIKILDFGIARAFHTQDGATGHTIVNETQIFNAFTPAYASCEIINNIPPTPKDDIYALGCIAHELLTQTHPYARVIADKAKEKKLTVRRNKYLAGHEHRAISHAVHLDKNKRVGSVNEFIHELTTPKTLPSLLSSRPVKIVGMAITILIVGSGLYTTNILTTDKSNTVNQDVNADNIEIGNILNQANAHMMNDAPGIQGKNEALALYHQALQLDPSNLQAKSGIEKIKQSYIHHIETAIDSKKLNEASELLKTIEHYFGDQSEIQHLKQSLNHHSASNQIELLVKRADQEEDAGFYVRPAEKNAYKTYLEILELSPEEPRATQGIERIREYLVNEAETMAQNGELKRAEAMIEDALLISPKSQDAIAVLGTINEQKLSETDEYIGEVNTHPRTEHSPSSQQQLIQLHTNMANKFIDQDNPYGPDNNNAAYHFRQILAIDPNNNYAQRGLDNAWKTMLENINLNVELNNHSVALEIIEESTKHFSPLYDTKQVISNLSAIRSKYLAKNQFNNVALRLFQAKTQLKADQLISPKGNNALESYLAVKNFDPGNKEAISGLVLVENKLSSLIKSHIDKQQHLKARELLRKALVVFPKSKKLYDLKLFLAKSNNPTIHNSHRSNPDTTRERGLESTKQITKLSTSAIVALKRKRYIFPVGRSAYDFYSKISSLAPGNSTGTEGKKEAKLRAYEQIEADIRDKNYQIAHLRIHRLSNLGVRDERLVTLQKSLKNADKSYDKVASVQITPINHLIYLLKFAQSQENNGVIWPPHSDNAYGVYKHVHDIEPLNKTARESLSKLFNSRISSIKLLLDNNRLHEAENELHALDKLYHGKKEKGVISKTTKALNELKVIERQKQKSEKTS